MATGNFNMEDPAKQEAIRRGSHEYIPTAGKHGAYVPKPYDRSKNEYPKMMSNAPRPELKDFLEVKGVAIPCDLAAANHQQALIEHDRMLTASIVNNKTEENDWLKKHGK